MSQLLNHISTIQEKLPAKVGDGCTIVHYSDREPGTIIEVSPSGKSIVIQLDKYTRLDSNGMSDAQTYAYERDPNGAMRKARLGKYGWRIIGSREKVLIRVRERYYDYSF